MSTISQKKQYYQTKRKLFINMLGGVCVKCGSIEQLEFDHIDPSKKTFNPSELWALSFERVVDELRKCQLLCKECHKKKTKSYRTRFVHGTLGGYGHHRCRCEKCRAVWNAKTKEYKLRSRLMVGQRSLKP